mgnify:CR=1 FL=1
MENGLPPVNFEALNVTAGYTTPKCSSAACKVLKPGLWTAVVKKGTHIEHEH